MTHMTGLTCFRCGARQAPSYDGYVCPSCAGNLDVDYDYEAIASEINSSHPFSGDRCDMFRFAPLLPLSDCSLAPPLRVGATPLYRAERLGADAGLANLYLKDESLNPSASLKDRASAVAVTRAVESGAAIVAAASTGNAGASLACMAAASNLPCVVFVPETAPPAKMAQLLVFGAHVLAVRGTYDDAFELCREVCSERGWLNRNTGYNPFTREGKKTCSYEVAEQLGWTAPDVMVVATGDGNIISGIWKGWKELAKLGLVSGTPKLVCAQAEGSAAITKALAGPGARDDVDWASVKIERVQASTLADSISVDQPRDGIAAMRAVVESGGSAVTVSDDAILEAVSELGRRAGLLAEPSAAAAWAAVRKMAGQGEIDPGARVVCLLTGSGLKDQASTRRAAGEPQVVAADLQSVSRALAAAGL